MKILHFSDTHLGRKRYNISGSQKDYIRTFEEVINLVYDLNPDIVLHSGDVFDMRRPDNITLSIVYKKFVELSKNFKILIVPGNHDFYTSIGISSLEPLNYFSENIKVFEYKHIFKEDGFNIDNVKFSYNGINFYCIPHFSDRRLLRELVFRINDSLNTNEINFIALHQIVDEEVSRRKKINTVDIPIEDLISFDYIFLGHFHTPIKKKKYAYVGSTEAVSYDEYEYDENGFIKENSKKRVILYEVLDKNELREYEYKLETPREFIRLEFIDFSIEQLKNTLKNYEDEEKIITLILKNIPSDAIVEIKSFISSFKFYHINTIISIKDEIKKFSISTEDNYKSAILGKYYDDIIKIISEVDDIENEREQEEKIKSYLLELYK
ncbi:MAG: metallophosphoesterase [candidate division WOR-3 bacterium]|nr:metallophosphoesterase [candidate division WOR-3 bacterium]MCX7948145.1 metallophosphoesterase [candidate division WOR-3 bacterium]MDW8151046.1 metallophosphoesterase [candidate division WOR-3 bacterium]